MDTDSPDPVIATLRAIAVAAGRIAASGDASAEAPDVLELKVVEILAAEPFSEQDAAEKLVRDALRD